MGGARSSWAPGVEPLLHPGLQAPASGTRRAITGPQEVQAVHWWSRSLLLQPLFLAPAGAVTALVTAEQRV